MMRTIPIVGLLAALAVWQGCSKQPSEATGSRPAPVATAPAAASSTRSAGRTYPPMPERMLKDRKASSSAHSQWALVQLALATSAHEEAVQAYARLREQHPNEQQLLALTGLQLVAQFLSVTPAEVGRAKTMLSEVKPLIEGADQKEWQGEHAYWQVVAHVAEGAGSLTGSDDVFSDWLQGLRQRVGDIFTPGCELEPLVHAFDHLIGTVAPDQPAVVDRLERTAVMLQEECGWASLDAVRALQERRIQILLSGKRATEALAESRILLALASQDARAWPASIERVAEVMTAASRDLKEVETFRALQKWGSEGPDGRLGTSDDLKDPLVGVRRDTSGLWSDGGREDAAPTAVSQGDLDEAIRRGVRLLLAGDGGKARAHFLTLVQSGSLGLDRHHKEVIDALAIAQAMVDGHALCCGRPAVEIAKANAEGRAGYVWRYEAVQFLKQREALVQQLIAEGQAELALACCRFMADEGGSPDRIRSAVNLASKACQAQSAGPTAAGVSRFQEFTRTLKSTAARVHCVRLGAETLKRQGDGAAVIAEIETLKDVWAEAMHDPQIVLMYASELVTSNRSAEALAHVKALCERADLPPETSWRAQIVLGVIYIQENQPAAARDVLRGILDEGPNRDYVRRIAAILRKIQI